MRLQPIVVRTCVSVLAAASVAAMVGAATPAGARSAGFDGMWSVVVVTEQGDCDRAYRYPIRITSDGTLENAGDTAFDISGKVGNNGKLVVRLSYGPMTAIGQGQLRGKGGAGQWTGGSCAGTWTAVRRG